MTLWTAANLYQLQLEEATIRELENEKKGGQTRKVVQNGRKNKKCFCWIPLQNAKDLGGGWLEIENNYR